MNAVCQLAGNGPLVPTWGPNSRRGPDRPAISVKPKPRFYSPAQVQKLLPELSLPCRTVVQVAVLTGMRIGEILALRWKRVDFLRKTLEVAETFSDGDFGTPKTNSSNRVLPISSSLCEVLEVHRFRPEIVRAG